MSHDGKHLYVTCEGSSDGKPRNLKPYRDPTNFRSTRNGPVLCPGCDKADRTYPYDFKRCDNESNGGGENNGLLAVIDVDKAIRGRGRTRSRRELPPDVRQFGQSRRQTVDMFSLQRVVEINCCRRR